jgi:hypothetical protein
MSSAGHHSLARWRIKSADFRVVRYTTIAFWRAIYVLIVTYTVFVIGPDLVPYLLVPCRDLPTACKQTHRARGLRTELCGTCALSDMCKGAMRKEAEAVSQLPQLVKTKTSRAITRMSGRKAS